MSVILFSCPKMASMASQIQYHARKFVTLGEIDWSRYNDGFPNTTIQDTDALRHADVAFLACFDSLDSTLEQLMALASLTRRHKIGSLKVILPFYPTGTKDRWELEGEVVTGYELAALMQAIPPTQTGPVDLVIYDIHALQEEMFFPKNIRVDLKSAMPLLRECLEGKQDVSIAFPDEGAKKRFGKYFADYPLIICEKRRNGDKREVYIREGDPVGRHVVAVDDLGLSGGTAMEAKTALLNAGALEVILFVTHGAFPKESWRKVQAAGFSEIWMTDSCPVTVEQVEGISPFKILPLAHSISDILLEDLSRRK